MRIAKVLFFMSLLLVAKLARTEELQKLNGLVTLLPVAVNANAVSATPVPNNESVSQPKSDHSLSAEILDAILHGLRLTPANSRDATDVSLRGGVSNLGGKSSPNLNVNVQW